MQIKKKKNTPSIYSTIKEQSCSWVELSGCAARRKAELVSICTRTTCWVTRSLASVKSSRLLLWLTLPATTSTLHHDLFRDSEDSGTERLRLRDAWHWSPGEEKHVDKCFNTHCLNALRFSYSYWCTVCVCVCAHRACLSVGDHKGSQQPEKWISYGPTVTFAVSPYDITHTGGNCRTSQSQSCHCEAANQRQAACILGAYASF